MKNEIFFDVDESIVVSLNDDMFWLSRSQIAGLYGKNKRTSNCLAIIAIKEKDEQNSSVRK